MKLYKKCGHTLQLLRPNYVINSNRNTPYIKAEDESFDDQYESVWNSIKEIDQEFTSENTSINSTKVPAVFHMVSFEPDTVNVDYGGGRYDSAADYLTQYDVINLVLDPFNRSKAHNREVINLIREHGGADTATCSNVLNVIKEPQNRIGVLENMKKLVKPGGKVYITVYEGSGKGNEGETKSGYQLNKKTADYMEEILQVFPNATRKGKLITAINDGSASTGVAASVMFDDDGRYEYVKSKSVEDSDGFLTDYTMYYDVLEDKYVFVFGDRDLYDPNDGYDEFDWECDTEQEADEWYYSYRGFIDDNIDVSESKKVVNCSTYGKYTYDIDIGFSVDVEVSADGVDEVYGTWKFDPIPNDRYGDAYIDEDTGAKIISVDDIAQYIIDALNENDEVTSLSGTVTVNGVAFFSVDIDSVSVTDDFRGLDEDGDPYYDTEYDAEYSDAIVKEYNISVLNTVPVA